MTTTPNTAGSATGFDLDREQFTAADLADIEALAAAAPKVWYGTHQIADGITDEAAVALIEACSPDTVLELIALARATPQHSVTEQAQPALTVWYGSLPESNGKSNFTAILMRKSGDRWDNMTDGITIDQSEYPDRVRYEADRVRYLIGELNERPDILAYDADKHSGYVKPDRAQPPASTASSEQQASVSEPTAWIAYYDGVKSQNVARTVAEKAEIEHIGRVMNSAAKITWEELFSRAALSGRATIPSEADERAYIPQWHTMLSADRNYTDPRTKREEAMCAEIAELRRALTPRATTADEQAAHLTDEGHRRLLVITNLSQSSVGNLPVEVKCGACGADRLDWNEEYRIAAQDIPTTAERSTDEPNPNEHEGTVNMKEVLTLLCMRTPQADGRNIHIVLKKPRYPQDGSIEDVNNHDRFLYNENTCPSNFLGVVELVDGDETDPVGLFQHVQTIEVLGEEIDLDNLVASQIVELFSKFEPFALDTATTAADQQGAAQAQAGDSVLAPIINAVEMHDATCLNSTIPDETLIWTATSVMGEQLHVTLGDFRRIAAMAAPATSGGSNG